MNEKSTKIDGWVLVNIDGFIMTWSFRYTRKGAIEELTKGSSKTWRKWYQEGVRCVKASKTITINT